MVELQCHSMDDNIGGTYSTLHSDRKYTKMTENALKVLFLKFK